ncbi:class V chitinase-like [Hibiscus syriacus]|uniref:class V chitinase-like n=1 Tax=Hibiscus syriacus TaxID=106335 RepID=UPI001924AC8F|nr:class V chitinase-like [Hibiscus syriacus]
MTSLGTFLDDWRAEVASESRNSGNPQLLLTMSAYRLPIVDSVSYPIDSAKRNLDWVNIMAYDYYVPTLDSVTGFHAALYDPSGRANTDAGIREWLNKGFPSEKLVLGLSYAWNLVNSIDNGIGSTASGPAVSLNSNLWYMYTILFLQNYGQGVESVYNSTYVVNLCKIGSNWINFDDVEAIKAKVSYAKVNSLLGYDAFELSNDDNWVLSQAAYETGTSQTNRLLVIVPVTIALVVILMVAIIYYLRKKICKSQESDYQLKKKHENGDSNSQVFSFSSIKSATNNFSNENKLGEGGYGHVYKGKLPKRQEIAVKRLSKSSNQGVEEMRSLLHLGFSM